jgi:hypothetical protein
MKFVFFCLIVVIGSLSVYGETVTKEECTAMRNMALADLPRLERLCEKSFGYGNCVVEKNGMNSYVQEKWAYNAVKKCSVTNSCGVDGDTYFFPFQKHPIDVDLQNQGWTYGNPKALARLNAEAKTKAGRLHARLEDIQWACGQNFGI